MRCLRMEWVVAVAALACATTRADAADMANPTGFNYYGYGQGSFDSTGYGPGMAGYGGAMPAATSGYGYSYASGPAYPGYGYGGYGNGAYGYGGYKYGAVDYGVPHGRRRHCRGFGGNCDCCNNIWDGYSGCADGGCGGPVRVRRRHRALGCGAGPCVDGSCGMTVGRRHHLHRRRRWNCPTGDCQSQYGAAVADPGMMYDGASQPPAAETNAGEQVQPPAPSLNYRDDEPQPTPADDSST